MDSRCNKGLGSTSILFVEARVLELVPPDRFRQIVRKQIFGMAHCFAKLLSWGVVLVAPQVVVGLSLLLVFVMCRW